MKAVFRNRCIRLALLVAAMVTAYFMGRLHGMVEADGAVNKVEQARLAAYRRAHSPLELAAIKNMSSDARMRLRLNSVKLGNSTLGVDQRGNYYIDGENLSILAKLDPKLALSLLAKLPNSVIAGDAYRSFFQEWAKDHPDDTDSIAAAAAELPQGPEKISALSGLAVAWAEQDPKAALDWASGLETVNTEAFKDALMYVSNQNPALAAQYIDAFPKADTRNNIILQIASSWGNANWNKLDRTDTGATLDWLNQVASGDTYNKAVQSIFWSYGYMDPATGATLVDKLTDPLDRSTAIKEMSIDWAVGQPAASMNWLQTLPDTDSAARNAALTDAFALWSKNNPAAAMDYVAGITDQTLLSTLAPSVAPAMAKQDPQAALNWVNGFPDSTAKTQAVSGVLTTMAASNFDGAWTYASNLPEGTGRDGAMDSLVSTLSVSNPAQAATLLGQLGSGAAVLSATTSVAFYWARTDPAGLTTWIGTQPAGGARDAAVEQFVNVQGAKDPAGAYALANTITDDLTRTWAIKSTVLQMAQKDLPAATQAAQTANLTEAQRQSLLLQLSQVAGK